MEYTNEPIMNIVWREASELKPNNYNPNVVLNTELNKLAENIIRFGWCHPVYVNQDDVIIDGFHRTWLAQNHKALKDAKGTKVPTVVLEMSKAEMIGLTVTTNRAKGVHVAAKMHELVKILFQDEGMSKEDIADLIGTNVEEVEVLLADDVFDKLNIKQHKYSKAWKPAQK